MKKNISKFVVLACVASFALSSQSEAAPHGAPGFGKPAPHAAQPNKRGDYHDAGQMHRSDMKNKPGRDMKHGAGVKAPVSGAGVKAPVSGHGVKAPVSGHGVKAPVSGHGVKAPVSGHGVKVPVSGPGVKAPVSGHGVKAPVSGHGVKAPVSNVKPDRKQAKPMSRR
ncbi:MAG: hypothetical protein IKW48_10565 [Akkermansia sp.]|nr:hypothetical protein [Akkermansia sp.]